MLARRQHLCDLPNLVCSECGSSADPSATSCDECGFRGKEAVRQEGVAEELYEGLHEGISAGAAAPAPVLAAAVVNRAVSQYQIGRVYFISGPGSADPIKIGFTSGDAETRLKGIQTGSPVRLNVIATIESDYRLENQIHRKFAQHRLSGEWFSRAPEIMEYIAQNAKTPSAYAAA
jgi:ribosomal protein L40E